MAASQSTSTLQKKKNNYKLLVDPELKKGHKKVYRLNGKDEPGFPPCGTPKDPRAQKTVLGLAGTSVDYRLPRFKFDKFWEGDPPKRDVFVIGLNESVKSSLFKEVCEGIGAVHAIKFHRHPKSKTFLGAATVSFVHSGVGVTAVGELDGKVIGGCYLRAELDDSGDHLKKYLEPVLKKCGLDKKPVKQHAQQLPGKASVSDSETDHLRTRSNSTTESVPDTDADTPQHITSAATTPITPTVKSDPVPNASFPHLFQFSILNIETPGSSSEGIGGGFGSPIFPTPCTPSSIDSGISIRTHNILSPSEIKMKRLSALTTTLPPLPPKESAPPLPPQDVEAPPPLPPLPPALGEDQTANGGIENISSDEEDTKSKPPLSTLPIFPSPSSSPRTNATASNHTFDPSVGLQTLLIDQARTSGEATETSFAVSSPKPAYELEVEEISGDESPVMVYFEPLKVESISDDDEEGGATGGGDDMEISDNENEQDNVIEVKVKTEAARVFPMGPMMEPHLPHMPHPSYHMGLPPPGYFPPPPPHHMGGFPPLHPHPYLNYSHPGMFPPASRSPPLPPDHSHNRRGRGEQRRRHDNSSPGPIIKDPQVSRPPNGYIGSNYHSRSYSKSKVLRNFPSPKSKTESISQDILFKAMEQLRLILLNDVHKKIVENSAYPLLDVHWKKREEEKVSQRSDSAHPSEGASEKDMSSSSSRPVEPYRRMMPGMKLKTEEAVSADRQRKEGREGEEEEEEEEEEDGVPALPTPRKRLMNFKIPLVRGSQRRDQQQSVVARRRLFKEGSQDQDETTSGSQLHSSRKVYSDISSSEDFSSSESEREDEMEEEGRESSESEPSMELPSSDSDSDFEKFLVDSKKKRKTSDISASEVRARTKKLKKKRPVKQRRPKRAVNDMEGAPKLYRDKENLEEEEEEEEVEVIKPVPLKPRYKQRHSSADLTIMESFVEGGLDKEDVQMFKLAFARLKGEEDVIVGDLPWAHYPHMPPSVPPPPPPTKRRRVSKYSVPVVEDHVTGCARSEGYYKIDMREKVKYLPHHKLKTTTTVSEQKKNVKSSGRVNRAKQRKLASLYSAGDISSDLAKYNQFKARKKQLKFAKSTIHNWGLFALESIPADEMVIEYVGQVVRQGVADERERRYEAAGIGSSYLFRVDHDYIIDATKRGGLARFINHCCDPNCYAKVINFSTGKKIVIYSKRDIALGEEITYDYKFPIEDEKIPCLCGAPNCRGTLN